MPLLALVMMAAAPTAATTTSNQVSAVTACRKIVDSQARLACYDSAAASLEQAVATRQVTVLTRSDVQQTRRSLFGFALPKLPFFGGDDEPAAKQLTAKVASVRSTGYGKWQFKLEDGATWETTESMNFGEAPSVNGKVTIKRGTMGNYFIIFDGLQPVRGRRIS
jgi:hypothetical protein